jgi:signal transduction histidine kinase
MNLYQVPPPEEAEPFSALQATRRRLTLWLAALSALASMLVWCYDGAHGLNSAWATVAVPIIASGLVLGGLVIWLRPLWHNQAAALCNASVATYFIGSLITTTEAGGPDGLYEVASNAQFMPLLYLATFVTMARGAARLSWLTYVATALSYLWLYGADGAPGGDHIGHFWFMLLITHPIFILALSYVSVLHTRLKSAEVEVHTSRERFLAMLSHEIRTPLQGMLGSIDLLDLRVHGGGERRAVDRLRQIANQLSAHLRDLTEYARMDNPAWRLQPEWIDLASLVEDICDEHLPRIRAKGLNLVVEIDDAPELREIEIDPHRVRQVLDNLLNNALKYTPHGQITVKLTQRAGSPDATGAPQAPRLQLEVIDTGVGIATEAMPRIFEPYVRLEDRKLPRTEGSGLGLAVVRRLVDRLGGQMAVESAPDRGSRFVVCLPVHPTPQPSASGNLEHASQTAPQ